MRVNPTESISPRTRRNAHGQNALDVTMPTPSSPRTALPLLLAAAAAGPGCGYSPDPYRELAMVSTAAILQYETAKQSWAETRATPLVDIEARREADLGGIRRLQAAAHNAPRCPLFHGRIAELYMALGADGHEDAARNFERALELCEDWVPSHLGLARVAILDGDDDAAKQHLRNARLATQRTADAGGPYENHTIWILGLRFNAPPRQDLMDPALGKRAGYKTLLQFFYEDLQWDIGNVALLRGDSGAEQISPGTILNGLRARIAYVEFMRLRRFDAPNPQEQLEALDLVLRFDPNHQDARLFSAFANWELRRYEVAYDLLDPAAARDNAMLLSDGTRRDLCARVVLDAWLDAPARANEGRALGYYTRMERLFGQYAQGADPLLAAAQVLFRGVEHRDAEGLAAARSRLLTWTTPDDRDEETKRKLGRAFTRTLQGFAAPSAEVAGRD